MKRQSQNETDILSLITKIQEQLATLDKKMDALLGKSVPSPVEMRPAPQPVAQPTTNANPPAPASGRPNQQPRARLMHQAVCAECKKECEVPFKPSGDRPVYCQECFTRRKSANKTKVEPEPKPVEEPPLPSVIDAAIDIPETPARDKKKPAARKPATRKKPVVKKKK